MDVLVCLAAADGAVVSRDTFQSEVWAPSVVSDHALNKCISALRKVFSEHSGADCCIETVPKRGFRLTVPVVQRSDAKHDALAHNGSNGTDSPVISGLPPKRTVFVGRKAEIEQLCQLMTANRLVSITGFGGVGKTRLAIESALRYLSQQPGTRAYFIDLSSHNDPTNFLGVIANCIGAKLESTNEATLKQIDSHIGNDDTLLIIDNCEHLIESVSDYIDRITQLNKCIRVLTTSREPLLLDGEAQFGIQGLSYDEEQGLGSDAVKLYCSRVAVIDSEFVPDNNRINQINQICRALNGIPLGIELVASRSTTLSETTILQQLNERGIDFLPNSLRGRKSRQESITGAIDWSYELLDNQQRRALQHLSIFSGNFDLQAAEAICSELMEGAEFIACLEVLCRKSWLNVDKSAEPYTYSFHNLVRQYLRGKLKDAGEYESVINQHVEYFSNQLQRYSFDERLHRLDIVQEHTRFMDDHLMALEWLESDNNIQAYADYVLELCNVWIHSRYQNEGRSRIQKLLSNDNVSIKTRFKLNIVYAWVCHNLSDAMEVVYLSRKPMIEGCEDIWIYSKKIIDGTALAHEDLNQARKLFQQVYKETTALDLIESAKTAIGASLQISFFLEENTDHIAKMVDHLITISTSYSSQGEGFIRTSLIGLWLLQGELDKAKNSAVALLELGRYPKRGSFIHEMAAVFLLAEIEVQSENFLAAKKTILHLYEIYEERRFQVILNYLAINLASLALANRNPETAYKLLWSSMNHKENISSYQDATGVKLHLTREMQAIADLAESDRNDIQEHFGNRHLKNIVAAEIQKLKTLD